VLTDENGKVLAKDIRSNDLVKYITDFFVSEK